MKTALSFFVTAACVLNSFAQIAPTESNLRSAIEAGGTIRFSSPGVIPISAPMAITKDTVIDGDANAVTLDGQSATNIFTVAAGVRLSLTNITFANGAVIMPVNSSSGTPAPAKGGAIQNTGGSVVAVDCVFSNNIARGADGDGTVIIMPGGSAFGGAIWQGAGSLSIQGGSFVSNRSTGGRTSDAVLSRGGAICVDAGTIEVSSATFTGNVVDGIRNSAASGGAIAVSSGTLQIQNSKLWNNVARGAMHYSYGGAISIEEGSGSVVGAHFLSNVVYAAVLDVKCPGGGCGGFPGYGGGVYNGTNANVVISQSTFEKCSTEANVYDYSPFGVNHGVARGGAIFNSGAASVLNSTLFGNSTYGFSLRELGAAIYNEGAIGLTNVTVAGNRSPQPILYGASGSMTLKNSLFGANDGVTATNVADAGHNLSATGSPVFTSASSRNNLDLRLGTLGDYGGPTPTIPLLAGSPAIDAADDAAAPATDQRGNARPYGAHADVGAFESGALFQSPIFYRSLQQVTFGFRAAAGETWRFDASGDFVQWVPVMTNSFPADGVFQAPVANAGAAMFVRAVKQ